MFKQNTHKSICSIPLSCGEGLGVRLALFALVFSFSSFASNPTIEKAKADFKKMNAIYLATPIYSMSIQYQVYDSHNGGNLIEDKMGSYIKNNSSSYNKILEVETIVTPKSTIVTNNEERFLVITDTKKIELSPIQTNMDTLLKLCSNIKVLDLGATKRQYTLLFSEEEEEAEFSKIEIIINLSTYTMDKLVLCYNQQMPLDQNDYYGEQKKPRLEITYKTFKSAITINPSLFTESTYCNLKGDNYEASAKYSSYKVINQLAAYRLKKQKKK